MFSIAACIAACCSHHSRLLFGSRSPGAPAMQVWDEFDDIMLLAEGDEHC